MSDETLYIYDRNTDYKLPPFGRYQKVARPDALALFTDSELIGELVRRGVLRTEQAPVWIDAWHVKEGEWISRFVSNWSEPVGSVGETP